MSAWDGGPPRAALAAVEQPSPFSEALIGTTLHLRTLLGEHLTGQVCRQSYA